MKKGAIYARYSSDKQTGETIKTQVDKCREFCDRQDILVCGEFIDEARTGTTEGGREEYARMLDMAGKGFFDTIVAYKYDRIGRSFVETVRSIYDPERYYNVNVYSATEPNEPLVRNILLSVAENFSRQHAARMHDTLSSTAGQGFHCGGDPPYGYIAVKQPSPSGRTDRKGNPIMHVSFEVEPEQAAIVRRIYRDYGDGLSRAQIADRLNVDGVLSPGKGTWDLGAVRYILSNEVYRGWRVWNKTKKVRKPDGKRTYRIRPRSEWIITKEAHPAIVDDDLWNAAEEARRRNWGYMADKGGRRTPYSKYPLTGLVKCETCGGNYLVFSLGETPQHKKYSYFRCGYHVRRGNIVCTNSKTIRRERIEGGVMDLLQREILTKQTVKMLIEDVREAWTSRKDGAKGELERVERELRKVEREITNLVNAIKTGGISGTLKAELDRCEERKAKLEKTRQELQQARPQADRLPTPEEIAGALEGFKCLLESGTPQEKKAVLGENIKRIVVRPSGEVLLEANPAGLLSGDLSLFDFRGTGISGGVRRRRGPAGAGPPPGGPRVR